jgi:hypothetical protein
MASKRLNERLREAILGNVLKEAFGPRREAHRHRQEALGDEIYASVIGEHERAMKQLPAGFFDLNRVISALIHIGAGDRRQRLQVPLTTERLMPAYTKFGGELVELKDSEPQAQRCLALEEELDAILRAERQMTEKLRSVLCSVGTLAALTKVWPEVAGYLPPEAAEEGAKNLPAVIVAEINQAIATAKAA